MKLKYLIKVSFLFCGVILSAGLSLAAKADSIKVACGSGVFGEVTASQAKFVKATGIDVLHSREGGVGADSGLVAVGTALVDVAILGQDWEFLLDLAKKKNLAINNLADFHHEELGKTKLLIITYRGGPAELSPVQIKSLLTGAISNWKSIGGEDVPVQIAIPLNSPANQKLVSQKLLGDEDIFRKGIKSFDNDELLNYVGSTRGAIGFIGGAFDVTKVNIPKQVGISKSIVAVTKTAPSEPVKKYLKHLREALSK